MPTWLLLGLLLQLPIVLGALASYWLTFRCCDGMAFSPVPWLGFFRWDVSGAVWLGLLVVAPLLLLPLAWLCARPERSNLLLPVVVVAAAIYARAHWTSGLGGSIGGSIGTRQAAQVLSAVSGQPFYASTDFLTYKKSMHLDTWWNELTLASQSAPIGLSIPSPVHVLNESVLSASECADAVAFTWAHAAELMHDCSRPIPSAYVTFGGDINFERHSTERHSPTSYSFQNGFEGHMGRLTGHHLDDAAHVLHVRKLYREGLAGQLGRVRVALERHLDSPSGRVVLGGDVGSLIEDFAPPSIIIQLPNVLAASLINPHHDRIPWAIDAISRRMASQHAGAKCGERSDSLFGGTIALEIPRSGAGLLWWYESKTMPLLRLHTPYSLGKLVVVPSHVYHSIAPWPYTGWTDSPRVTMQMFVVRCDVEGGGMEGGGGSWWYAFH